MEIIYKEFILKRNYNQTRQLEVEQAILATFHNKADMIREFYRLSRTVNTDAPDEVRPEYLT